jgi:hypothetical protein
MVVGLNKIESVIDEILTFPVKKGLDAVKHGEIVIKILKKFGLGTPGKDATFEHVYVYTLVEFGVGKEKPILDFFRHPDIKKAFQRSFEENNPAFLHREADWFIQWNRVGDDLREIGVDPRREFAGFTLVFICSFPFDFFSFDIRYFLFDIRYSFYPFSLFSFTTPRNLVFCSLSDILLALSHYRVQSVNTPTRCGRGDRAPTLTSINRPRMPRSRIF